MKHHNFRHSCAAKPCGRKFCDTYKDFLQAEQREAHNWRRRGCCWHSNWCRRWHRQFGGWLQGNIDQLKPRSQEKRLRTSIKVLSRMTKSGRGDHGEALAFGAGSNAHSRLTCLCFVQVWPLLACRGHQKVQAASTPGRT